MTRLYDIELSRDEIRVVIDALEAWRTAAPEIRDADTATNTADYLRVEMDTASGRQAP